MRGPSGRCALTSAARRAAAVAGGRGARAGRADDRDVPDRGAPDRDLRSSPSRDAPRDPPPLSPPRGVPLPPPLEPRPPSRDEPSRGAPARGVAPRAEPVRDVPSRAAPGRPVGRGEPDEERPLPSLERPADRRPPPLVPPLVRGRPLEPAGRPEDGRGDDLRSLMGARAYGPTWRKMRRAPPKGCSSCEKFGGVLLSQGFSPQVPSAQTVLTSVFGMGTGVTLSLWPPKSVVLKGS